MKIAINGSELFYHREGHGPEKLLLFHGFGQDHRIFSSLAKAIADDYSCYIFDLYFHGESTWANDEEPLEKKDWKVVLEAFLANENISTFSLLGYSLGAKLVLATVELLPAHTKTIFLVAPDGIKTNFWYRAATSPPLRKFFKGMVLHPGRFFGLANLLRKTGIAPESLLRFAEYQMNTEEKRRRVYYSWLVMRKLRFNMKRIASLINDHNITTTIIIGRSDPVIKPENIQRLTQHLEKCHVEILNAGHTGIIPVLAERIFKKDQKLK